MILIGISGKKQTGKNTVAKFIAANTALKCEEFAFADSLKNEVARLCQVSRDEIERNKPRFRTMLQAWGVYRRESLGDDCWVRQVIIKMLASNADIAFITDVRFQNEANYVKEMGGFLIRVSRDTGLNDNHISETDLDKYEKWDGIILNTGSMEQLGIEIKDVMNKLKIKL